MQYLMFRFLGPFLIFSLIASTLYSASDSVGATAKDDLQDALQRLAVQRKAVRTQYIPLAKNLNELEATLAERRRELAREQLVSDELNFGIKEIERDMERVQEHLFLARDIMANYWRDFESQVDVSELSLYEPEFMALKTLLDGHGASLQSQIEALSDIVLLSIDRDADVLGGQAFDGAALLPNGFQEPGSFVLWGPYRYFLSDSGEAGVVTTNDALHAYVRNPDSAIGESVEVLLEKGQGRLPMDISLGAADGLSSQNRSWWAHIEQGGFWIFPILALALLSIIVAVYKARALFKIRLQTVDSVDGILAALKAGNMEEARQLVGALSPPYRGMLEVGLEHYQEEKILLEESLYENMLKVQPRLESGLFILSITAGVAPLLGLLGTVTGMIGTFQIISMFGSSDAQLLSGGISEALITTEYGLIVAIPALILHAVFARRAQAILAEMERLAIAFINGVARAVT